LALRVLLLLWVKIVPLYTICDQNTEILLL
jgi:hypothetical protein